MSYFSESQTSQFNELARRLEQRTGVEVMAAVVGKCDSYPEIPWKAFALGAALGALGLLIRLAVHPTWLIFSDILVHTAVILGIGAGTALLTSFWLTFGRVFLDPHRANQEVRQYAQAMFLERELFKTPQRYAILLLVGLFERQVVILPDSGIEGRLPHSAFKNIVRAVTVRLRQGEHYQALADGLEALEDALKAAGFKAGDAQPDLIKDEFIEEKGVE